MWTYEPFRLWFVKNHPRSSREDIARQTQLSRHTITKIWKDEHVMTHVIERLCETYNLPVEQVCRWEPQKKGTKD
jgi:DNA-binding Xre family transcriptional regulator